MTSGPGHVHTARAILAGEAAALQRTAERLDADGFDRAVEILHGCTGKVLLTGAGVSGVIARKIAATLTSTGTPSLFLHPADALHGGMGMVEGSDVVIALSNSGETSEILALLPYLRARETRLVAIVGNLKSRLAIEADVVLDGSVDEEVGTLGLAPTSSSTVALALGDALALAVAAERDLTPDDFARNHPSGRLGRRLTLRIDDVVPGGLPLPWVDADASLLDALSAIGDGGVGAVMILDEHHQVEGLLTDGDVRRALRAGVTDLSTPVAKLMTRGPLTAARGTLAIDVLRMMEDRPSQLSVMPIVDADDGRCVGIVRIHDLVKAGL